jgi:hypothetical protein
MAGKPTLASIMIDAKPKAISAVNQAASFRTSFIPASSLKKALAGLERRAPLLAGLQSRDDLRGKDQLSALRLPQPVLAPVMQDDHLPRAPEKLAARDAPRLGEGPGRRFLLDGRHGDKR